MTYRLRLGFSAFLSLLLLGLFVGGVFVPKAQAENRSLRPASTPAIALVGIMGGKVSIIMNSEKPHMMEVGQRYRGIELLRVHDYKATFLIKASDQSMRWVTVGIGQAPILLSTQGSADNVKPEPRAQHEAPRFGEIVIDQSSDGHYYLNAMINGQPIRFMVDTGAAAVTITPSDASKVGIDIRRGSPIKIRTANGESSAFQLVVSSINVDSTVVHNVVVNVVPSLQTTSLLGQSFLSRFNVEVQDGKMHLKMRF